MRGLLNGREDSSASSMVSFSSKRYLHSSGAVVALTVTLLLVAGYLYFNFDNFYFSSSSLLGILFAPYIFRRISQTPSSRFLWIALILGGLLYFRRSSSLFYFFTVTSVMYILESQWGRLNNLPIFLLGLMSALTGHIAYIWSFPIRLQLSEWAAKSLTAIGLETVARGNVIVRDGYEFTVDPACMGLQMLITAGIIGLLMMANLERKQRYVFSIWQISGYLGIMLGLAVLANFTRLLSLVVFRIGPAHPLHAGIGLFSLLVYALIPFYLLLAYGKRWPKEEQPLGSDPERNLFILKRTYMGYGVLLLILAMNGPKFLHTPLLQDDALVHFQLPGYDRQLLKNGVLQLKNDDALVYVKPSAGPLQSAHDPRICWEGTGYRFAQIQKQQIGEEWFYTAHLEKDEDKLYTAWWFDNGQERTIGEWTWRWNTLRLGRGFRLVNVTVGAAGDLEQEVLKIQQLSLDQ